MKKSVAVAALGLLASRTSISAQGVSPPAAEELMAITRRGILLTEYDRAAWHASDALQAANPKTAEGQRCVAKKENGEWHVVFGRLNADKSLFRIYYEAVQQGKPQEFAVSAETAGRADNGFYLFAARAIEVALEDFRGEKRPYNVAVLPAREDRLFVYVYPAETVPRIHPLGGDVRYLLSADGKKIIEKRQMHNSILESRPSEKGKKPAAGMHSHAPADLPEDTDVFHVLTEDPPVPETIDTAHFVYRVQTDGTIAVVKVKK
jgi:hypothetical protein